MKKFSPRHQIEYNEIAKVTDFRYSASLFHSAEMIFFRLPLTYKRQFSYITATYTLNYASGSDTKNFGRTIYRLD